MADDVQVYICFFFFTELRLNSLLSACAIFRLSSCVEELCSQLTDNMLKLRLSLTTATATAIVGEQLLLSFLDNQDSNQLSRLPIQGLLSVLSSYVYCRANNLYVLCQYFSALSAGISCGPVVVIVNSHKQELMNPDLAHFRMTKAGS